jgi:hypothetical protein
MTPSLPDGGSETPASSSTSASPSPESRNAPNGEIEAEEHRDVAEESPLPSGQAINGAEAEGTTTEQEDADSEDVDNASVNGEEDSEDDDDESYTSSDEDEDEPSLKYSRLGTNELLSQVFSDDSASALAVSSRLIVSTPVPSLSSVLYLR